MLFVFFLKPYSFTNLYFVSLNYLHSHIKQNNVRENSRIVNMYLCKSLGRQNKLQDTCCSKVLDRTVRIEQMAQHDLDITLNNFKIIWGRLIISPIKHSIWKK